MNKKTPQASAPEPLTGLQDSVAHKKYHSAKYYCLRGLLLLLTGSLMLLSCKLPVPSLLGTLCAYSGGVIILLGNGYILFGLLIFADSRNP